MEQNKNEIIKKAKEIIEQAIKSGKKYEKELILSALALAAGTLALNKTVEQQPQIAQEPVGKGGVISNVTTNCYNTPEFFNACQTLTLNDIITYQPAYTQTWKQNDEKTLSFLHIHSVLPDSRTTINNLDSQTEYTENNTYVLESAIDKYVECSAIENLNFRLRPDFSQSDPIKVGSNRLFVNISSEGTGQHNFKKAILIDNDGNFQRGYVADENDYISPNLDSNIGIGVVNDTTYLRVSAELAEFDESKILGQMYNGDRLRIIDDSPIYYKCTLESQPNCTPFYISKKAVTLDEEFDCTAHYLGENGESSGLIYGFDDDGSLIVRQTLDNNDAVVNNTDALKVNIHKSKGNYYSVYDTTTGVVGYIDGKYLIDDLTNYSIYELYSENTPIVSSTSTTIQTPLTISSTAQTLQTTSAPTQTLQTNSNAKQSIMLDSKTWANPQALKNVVESFKNKNVDVGGVIISIGSSYGNLDQMAIGHYDDDTTIYAQYLQDNDVTSMQKTFDEINRKASYKVDGNTSRGSMTNLTECMKYLMEQNIPIGLFYYSAECDAEETSIAAAYCYGFVKYLNEYVPGYRMYQNKIPFVIDIENNDGGREAAEFNPARGKNLYDFVRLLGNGVDSTEASKFFCIDGRNPSEGYNIISKDTGIIFYGDVRQNGASLYELLPETTDPEQYSFTSLTNTLKNDGYAVNLWATLQLRNEPFSLNGSLCTDETTQKLTNPSVLHDSLSSTVSALPENHQDLFNQASIAQVMLQKKSTENSCVFDISVTTDKNIYNLIHGLPNTESLLDEFKNMKPDHELERD